MHIPHTFLENICPEVVSCIYAFYDIWPNKHANEMVIKYICTAVTRTVWRQSAEIFIRLPPPIQRQCALHAPAEGLARWRYLRR